MWFDGIPSDIESSISPSFCRDTRFFGLFPIEMVATSGATMVPNGPKSY